MISGIQASQGIVSRRGITSNSSKIKGDLIQNTVLSNLASVADSSKRLLLLKTVSRILLV